jgi:hypothetical protein
MAAVGYGAYVDREFRSRIRDFVLDSREKRPFSLTGGWRPLATSQPAASDTPDASGTAERQAAAKPDETRVASAPLPAPKDETRDADAQPERSDGDRAPVAADPPPVAAEGLTGPDPGLHVHAAISAIAALPLPMRGERASETTDPQSPADSAAAGAEERSSPSTGSIGKAASSARPAPERAATESKTVAKPASASPHPASQSHRLVRRRLPPSSSSDLFPPWPWKVTTPPTFDTIRRAAP